MDDDIDGVPLGKDQQDYGDLGGKNTSKSPAFIPSKWETIDPEQVEAQAVTTSKWDALDPPEAPKFFNNSSDDEDDDDALSFDEIKRKKLREIEVKTMQYQDALESGEVECKLGLTVPEQVEHYRKRLLKKVSGRKSQFSFKLNPENAGLFRACDDILVFITTIVAKT